MARTNELVCCECSRVFTGKEKRKDKLPLGATFYESIIYRPVLRFICTDCLKKEGGEQE